MSVLAADYSGQTILIYDMDGNHLIDTVVLTHNKTEKQLYVKNMPPRLKVNEDCKLLIMTSPAPCEYVGKVKKVGGELYLALFQGQVKETRAATRYKVNTPAAIDLYICEGQEYKLYSPVKVSLLNISTSGVRFRAPFYSLNDGDQFRINMTIKGNKKSLVAETINHLDNETATTDYGCRFIG
ncbi:MAG: PilZ domain-containing protein [Oscillospiraceae bacterium]|nr:PilZ domain-containing protein [Oscillospiraceae bacterium]